MIKIFSRVNICLFLIALNTPLCANVTTPPSDMFVRLASNGKLYVQAGAFKSAENAHHYRQKLSQLTRHSVVIESGEAYHRDVVKQIRTIQLSYLF